MLNQVHHLNTQQHIILLLTKVLKAIIIIIILVVTIIPAPITEQAAVTQTATIEKSQETIV